MMMTTKMMTMGMATHRVMMMQSFLFLDLRITACSGERRGRKSERRGKEEERGRDGG